MSRMVNPIMAANAAMKSTARRRVVQKVLAKSSTKVCEKEFMELMKVMPVSVEEHSDPKKAAMYVKAKAELDTCMQEAANHNGQDYVSTRMKQLSEIAATKKRRRRTGIGRGRWNPCRVI